VLPEDFRPSADLWRWSCAGAPRGLGHVVIARAIGQGNAWVVAPPAVSLGLGESDDLLKRWRVARFYAADPAELVISLGDHVSGTYHAVTVDDVRSVMPACFQGWITSIDDRQRALADGFGRQDPRLAPKEAHVRAAATRYAEVAGTEACRQRANDEFEDALVDVPDTVGELLERAAGKAPAGSAQEVASTAATVWRSPTPVDVHGSRRKQDEPGLAPAPHAPPKPAARLSARCVQAMPLHARDKIRTTWPTFALVATMAAVLLTATLASMTRGSSYSWLVAGGISVLVGTFLWKTAATGGRSAGAKRRAVLGVVRKLITVRTIVMLSGVVGLFLVISHVQYQSHSPSTSSTTQTQLSRSAHHAAYTSLVRTTEGTGSYLRIQWSDGVVVLRRPRVVVGDRWVLLQPADSRALDAMDEHRSWFSARWPGGAGPRPGSGAGAEDGAIAARPRSEASETRFAASSTVMASSTLTTGSEAQQATFFQP
jgi:hypothetical protein